MRKNTALLGLTATSSRTTEALPRPAARRSAWLRPEKGWTMAGYGGVQVCAVIGIMVS